ncbi:chemotaxis protein CheR [Acuticoccus sp. M5D2P5]|uniref:CheR family methyltransferase n=1 Tax=Acuticoccus kalidii TaxID=2910977 RepID=UPI001F3D7892|nr:CheR family methyltransferase [Acuticoccus kalidii]MCF3932958.1 chemotaxis protein CheR [Acuticoccus kalidii]
MHDAETTLRTVDDRRFDKLTALIRREIGVRLPTSKRQMVESRLRRRIVDTGFTTLDDYMAHLFDHDGLADELDVIFDAVTTNKTDFFREPAHFEFLAERILPARRPGGARFFKVWSAAASCGAEAWSTAMVLADHHHEIRWSVLGTDINTRVIAQARRAIYPSEQLAPVPRHLRERYVMIGTGEMTGSCRIHPDLRRRVSFNRLNLMAPSYPVDRDIDVIFLRNVLIYFAPEDQARVIARLAGHLAPGGFFLVGHSESMVVDQPDLEQVAPAVFRKV